MYHINYLELSAAFLTLQSFAKHSSSLTIKMKIDNVTAMTYINKLGSTHSLVLCQLALTIWKNQTKFVLISNQRMGFLGCLVDTSDIPSREAGEHPTVGTPPPLSTKSLSERHSKVRGKSFCIHKKI